MRYLLLILVLLLAGGCNLFSPFHDEGKSDDLDDIVGDVEAALERGEPAKAYEYAVAGIEKHPESLALHYLGAVARVQSAEIGFSDFSAIFRSDGDDLDGGDMASVAVPFVRRVAQGDTVFFFELPDEELAGMADAFNTSFGLLESAAGLLGEGNVSAEDRANFEGDTYLGLGVSAVVTAMLTIIDQDRDLGDGFMRDPEAKVFETDEAGWGFSGSITPDVVCDEMALFGIADEALYDHYRVVVGGDLPLDIPSQYIQTRVENWQNPMIDDGTLTGEIFGSVHDSVVNFRENFFCGEKGEGR